MTRFTRIRIQDYKSIRDVTLEIQPGLYKVVGESQGYSSNGSGKTTVTQAIVLGLFNRDFSGSRVDEVSNRVTGKDFIITIDFDKEDASYQIINNRRRKTMTISKDGHQITSGYKDSGTLITKLLGMGYETFVLTHFITSKTVGHITENLSNPSLFNDILQIAQLKDLDKKFLEVSKELKSETSATQKELNTIEAIENTLKITRRFDLPMLQENLATANSAIRSHTLFTAQETAKYKPAVEALQKELRDLTSQLYNVTDILSDGVCPTCSSVLASKSELSWLEDQVVELNNAITIVSNDLEEAQAEWRAVSKKLDATLKELTASKYTIEADLRVAEEIEVNTLSTSVRSAGEVQDELDKLQALTRYVSYTREQIKEGTVVKELLENFFAIVSTKMNDYSALINMNGLDVEVLVNKLGMGVTLHRNQEFIPISTLSNGEKTRLSLLVLISMLAAMKEVSDAETNYLVFDEASASFDASGIDELEALFSYMKNMGQACFVITHGNEMAKVSFDYEIVVSKHEGISDAGINTI